MKKIVLSTVFFLLAASLTFAQKKAVKAASDEIKGTTPNIENARNLIKDAFTNPESAEDAETWYTAGVIENKQFDTERTNEMLGKQPNDTVMYKALDAIWPYFQKALKFDSIPDAKGKVKPRFTKDIKAYMLANRPYYPNAGIYYYNNKDYQKAYENFKLYGDYKKMDLFAGEKWTVADSVETQIRYYAGRSAALIPNHPVAIEILEEIKNVGGTDEAEIYQILAGEYLQVKDTVNFQKTIEAGYKKFPQNDYFLLNLINQNISKGKSNEAIDLLNTAIAKAPSNAQLYDVLGQVYDGDKKTDEAILNMKKAVELEPNNADYLTHLGSVYLNLGVDKRGESDQLKDQTQSKIEFDQAMDNFKQALPYFEKVFELEPQNAKIVMVLGQIYYTLGMNDKYEKMDSLYNSLTGGQQQ